MKTMTRRPFVYITGFYSLGIVLNHLALFPFGYFCLLTFIFLVISAGISKRTFASTVFLMLAVTGLGAVYAQSRQCADKNHIMHVAKYYRKKPVKMKGVVVSDIQERKSANGFKTTFTLDVREVEAKWGWQEKKGRILVNIFRDSDVVYGDYVCLEDAQAV
jgi:hypothetical protein